MRWYVVFILGLAVLAAGGASPAAAQHARDHVRAGRVQPLDRILNGVRQSRPGTFYDADGPFQGADGRYHYRLKWMTPSGRIIWLDTDAHTGRVLGVERGQRRPSWDRGGDRNRDRAYERERNYQQRDYRDRDYRGNRNQDRRYQNRQYRDRQYRNRQERRSRNPDGRYRENNYRNRNDWRGGDERRGNYRNRGNSNYNGNRERGGNRRRPHGW